MGSNLPKLPAARERARANIRRFRANRARPAGRPGPGPEYRRNLDYRCLRASPTPGRRPGLDRYALASYPGVTAALAQAHRRGIRIMSICTGAFILAEAGLLDGLRATTHWSAAAGLDLCLHVVRRDHGAAVAADVARFTVIAPHREGGQAQFIPLPARTVDTAPTDGTTEAARTWALAHLDQPISVEDLAVQAVMSRRTFVRRFRSETGTTAAQWLLQQRLRAASRCWKPPTTRSSRSPSRAVSATLPPCAPTSAGACAPPAYRRTFTRQAG